MRRLDRLVQRNLDELVLNRVASQLRVVFQIHFFQDARAVGAHRLHAVEAVQRIFQGLKFLTPKSR